MPSHTPEDQINALINPMAGLAPGQPINPILGSQAPQPQPQGPAGGGGGGLLADLFGGGVPQQGLSPADRGAAGRQSLIQAGRTLAESGSPDERGFTPSFLTSLVNAVGAGRETFSRSEAAAVEKRRRNKLAAALSGAGTSEERVAVYRQAMFQFIADDKFKMVEAMQSLVDGEEPDVTWSTISLGNGQYLTYNDKNADVIEGGTRLPEDPTKIIGRPIGPDGVPETERRIGYHPPGDPQNVTWTDVLADVPKADGTRAGSANEDTSLAGLNISTGLEGYTQLFGNVDLNAPFDPANYVDGPRRFLQWGLNSKNVIIQGLAKALSNSREQGFNFANNLAKEALGRISSGAVINEGELQTFRDMLPSAGDTPRIMHIKMLWMRDFNNILIQAMNDQSLVGAAKGVAIRTSGIWNEANRQLLGLGRVKTPSGDGRVDPFGGLRPEG